jgi:hypothetical protein
VVPGEQKWAEREGDRIGERRRGRRGVHHQVSNTRPIPTTTPRHLPTLPFYTARPKPSYGRSNFGFLAQPPPPGLALVNVQPPCHLHIINTHPPPPSITPHCHFTRRARNRATNARFLGFWLNPRPLASRWRMPSPPAASTSSTRTHHLPPLSHIAVSHGMPETEQRTLSFGILAQNRDPPACDQTNGHSHSHTSPTSPQQPRSAFPAVALNGAP